MQKVKLNSCTNCLICVCWNYMLSITRNKSRFASTRADIWYPGAAEVNGISSVSVKVAKINKQIMEKLEKTKSTSNVKEIHSFYYFLPKAFS